MFHISVKIWPPYSSWIVTEKSYLLMFHSCFTFLYFNHNDWNQQTSDFFVLPEVFITATTAKLNYWKFKRSLVLLCHCFLNFLFLPTGAFWHVMTLASSWLTSSSLRWSVMPSTPTCSQSRLCWRSRPKSIHMTLPRTPSCAVPRACSLPRTSDNLSKHRPRSLTRWRNWKYWFFVFIYQLSFVLCVSSEDKMCVFAW